MRVRPTTLFLSALVAAGCARGEAVEPPPGSVALFNGRDLDGWLA